MEQPGTNGDSVTQSAHIRFREHNRRIRKLVEPEFGKDQGKIVSSRHGNERTAEFHTSQQVFFFGLFYTKSVKE